MLSGPLMIIFFPVAVYSSKAWGAGVSYWISYSVAFSSIITSIPCSCSSAIIALPVIFVKISLNKFNIAFSIELSFFSGGRIIPPVILKFACSFISCFSSSLISLAIFF